MLCQKIQSSPTNANCPTSSSRTGARCDAGRRKLFAPNQASEISNVAVGIARKPKAPGDKNHRLDHGCHQALMFEGSPTYRKTISTMGQKKRNDRPVDHATTHKIEVRPTKPDSVNNPAVIASRQLLCAGPTTK